MSLTRSHSNFFLQLLKLIESVFRMLINGYESMRLFSWTWFKR